MSYERIQLDFDGSLARLTFNDPDTLNSVSVVMLRELSDAAARIADPANGARCLLITGAGRGFCAGANLADNDRDHARGEERDLSKLLKELYHPFLLSLRDLDMPIVTAVNGPAAGVGMSFALMGDMVLAARGAYFLQAFRRIGLVPDGGSTYLLPRMVGWTRAMELSLMGEKLPAEKALEWGLINRVYDDATLMDEAVALARELAKGPTKGLSLLRKAYWHTFENTYEAQLDLEADLQKIAGRTDDFVEGVSAFLQKRPANFQGK